MSIRSITIEGVSVEALERFKAATKAIPGHPKRAANTLLELGLAAHEAEAKKEAAKAAREAKKAEAKAATAKKTTLEAKADSSAPVVETA